MDGGGCHGWSLRSKVLGGGGAILRLPLGLVVHGRRGGVHSMIDVHGGILQVHRLLARRAMVWYVYGGPQWGRATLRGV